MAVKGVYGLWRVQETAVTGAALSARRHLVKARGWFIPSTATGWSGWATALSTARGGTVRAAPPDP